MRRLTNISLVLFCIGAVLTMLYFATALPFNDHSQVRDAETFSWYGTFISGVFGTLFTIGSFILLFFNLRHEQQTARAQRAEFDRTFQAQRASETLAIFEKRFYEMAQIHRSNVSDMEMTVYTGTVHINGTESKYMASGRQVFKLIADDFYSLEAETAHLFGHQSIHQIYLPDYLSQLLENTLYSERQLSLEILAKYDLLYLILFFGIGESGKAIALDFLARRYQPAFYQPVIDLAALKPKKNSRRFAVWEKMNRLSEQSRMYILFRIQQWREPDEEIQRHPRYHGNGGIEAAQLDQFYYANDYEKYYGGHQFRLGHYFRHLFQAVKFVNDYVFDSLSPSLNVLVQYNYVKFLRAQLSTFEQILLAVNSISILGRAWEMERHGGVAPQRSERLISKYNLVRNVPGLKLLKDLDLQHIFPLVDFEVINDQSITEPRARVGYAN